MEHNECCCIFDTSRYTGTPDNSPCPSAVDVPELIRRLDALYEQGRENEAEGFLEKALGEAREGGDWRAELSILSELLGQYRRSGSREKGIGTVNDALELIRRHSMGYTVSGATVMLNAATTLKAFGEAEQSLPIFAHTARVYSSKLDPSDYRFAGLYNNMALSCADAGRFDEAERYFKLALSVMKGCPNPENDMAVTYCNLAELYSKRSAGDSRIDDCMEKAWELLDSPTLPQDGYHAFTVSKCVPTFDYFGYFLYAKELKERAAKIYAGS